MCKCGEGVCEHVSVSVKLPLVSFLNVLVCVRGVAQSTVYVFACARVCNSDLCVHGHVCMCVCPCATSRQTDRQKRVKAVAN